MSSAIDPKFTPLFEEAYYIWFTTVRPDGMPQPTPVWFVWDGDTFLIYTMPSSQKAKNFEANPHVALSYNNDAAGEQYVVVMGEAKVDSTAPLPSKNAAYVAKYAAGITRIGMTLESFDATYHLALRVTPTKMRGE